MEIYLDKDKLENILGLYYSNISHKDCKVVIKTSVEFYEGRYNEDEEKLVVSPQITTTVDYYGQEIEIIKTIKEKDVEDVIAIFLKDELPSIEKYDYKFSNRQFEGVIVKHNEKYKTYRLNNLDD